MATFAARRESSSSDTFLSEAGSAAPAPAAAPVGGPGLGRRRLAREDLLEQREVVAGLVRRRRAPDRRADVDGRVELRPVQLLRLARRGRPRGRLRRRRRRGARRRRTRPRRRPRTGPRGACGRPRRPAARACAASCGRARAPRRPAAGAGAGAAAAAAAAAPGSSVLASASATPSRRAAACARDSTGERRGPRKWRFPARAPRRGRAGRHAHLDHLAVLGQRVVPASGAAAAGVSNATRPRHGVTPRRTSSAAAASSRPAACARRAPARRRRRRSPRPLRFSFARIAASASSRSSGRTPDAARRSPTTSSGTSWITCIDSAAPSTLSRFRSRRSASSGVSVSRRRRSSKDRRRDRSSGVR